MPSLWSLSVPSCCFLQILLLFGYSWRNRYNLDSLFKTNNRKKQTWGEKQLLSQNNLLEPLNPLSWCKLFQVWVCPSPDGVSSLSYFALTDFCRFIQRMKRLQDRWFLQGCFCSVIYFKHFLLMPIAQFHLWFQRKRIWKIFLPFSHYRLNWRLKFLGCGLCAASYCIGHSFMISCACLRW